MKDIRNVPTDRLGRVGKTTDGQTYVEFIRFLSFSPEEVWQAITDPTSLADWFPGFQLEQRQSGLFQIWFGGACEGPAHVSGTVDVFDPPNVLQCGTMRWLLEAVPGGCQLTFTDVLRLKQDHRGDFEITNSVLAGWHFYMDKLEESLIGNLDPSDTIEYDYAQIEILGRAIP